MATVTGERQLKNDRVFVTTYTPITLFSTFLSRHYTTTTWREISEFAIFIFLNYEWRK